MKRLRYLKQKMNVIWDPIEIKMYGTELINKLIKEMGG